MAGTSIDGLISGLNTTALVNQLMQVEAIGQTQLKARVSSNDLLLTALRGVNTKITALQTAATALTKPATWTAATTTVTGTSVTASASSSASPGRYTIDVTQVAAAHAVSTQKATSDLDDTSFLPKTGIFGTTPGKITINGTTIQPAEGSLRALVTAINTAEGLGVTARAVQTGPSEYRLQIVADKTGADSQFTVGGDLATNTNVQGKDTTATVNGLAVRSSSATLNDIVPGVTVSVRDLGTSTIDVAHDPASLADAMEAMVKAANAALDDIGTKTAYDSTSRTGGPLTGNAAVRQLNQDLLRSVPGGLGSPLASTAGVQTTKEGRLVFDRDAFMSAYAADPDAVRAAIAPTDGSSGLAQRLVAVAESAVRTTAGNEGTLVRSATGVESRTKDLNKQIEAWDTRLALRRETLQRQFSGLEVALSKLQNQSQWLSGQLASLSGTSA